MSSNSPDPLENLPLQPSEIQKLGAWISGKEIADLSSIQHGRVVAKLIVVWGLLLFTLEFGIWSASWTVYGFLFFVMGFLHHNLIAWTHEAAHFGLTRNKKLNDCLADLFISGPVGLAVRQYRWVHFRHHRYLNNPYKEIDMMPWECIRGGNLFFQIFQHLAGVYLLRLFGRYGKPQDVKNLGAPGHSRASLLGFLVLNLSLFALCVRQGAWYAYFVLWALPLVTIALLMTNFRTIVEHQPSSDVCDLGQVPMPAMTRCVRANSVEKFLIAPVGFFYHYEHHLLPSIPCHRLAEFRRLLRERGYFDQPGIIWVDGYVRTIWRLAMTPGYGVRILPELLKGPNVTKMGQESSPLNYS